MSILFSRVKRTTKELGQLKGLAPLAKSLEHLRKSKRNILGNRQKKVYKNVDFLNCSKVVSRLFFSLWGNQIYCIKMDIHFDV